MANLEIIREGIASLQEGIAEKNMQEVVTLLVSECNSLRAIVKPKDTPPILSASSFELSNCRELEHVSLDTINGLKNFTATGCYKLKTVNNLPETLETFRLSSRAVVELNFTDCSELTSLDLSGCIDLKILNLTGCDKLKTLDLTCCDNLRRDTISPEQLLVLQQDGCRITLPKHLTQNPLSPPITTIHPTTTPEEQKPSSSPRRARQTKDGESQSLAIVATPLALGSGNAAATGIAACCTVL